LVEFEALGSTPFLCHDLTRVVEPVFRLINTEVSRFVDWEPSSVGYQRTVSVVERRFRNAESSNPGIRESGLPSLSTAQERILKPLANAIAKSAEVAKIFFLTFGALNEIEVSSGSPSIESSPQKIIKCFNSLLTGLSRVPNPVESKGARA